jgi:hypothetical protein
MLVALIGGITVFGVAGLIVGPVAMALFVATARILEREQDEGGSPPTRDQSTEPHEGNDPDGGEQSDVVDEREKTVPVTPFHRTPKRCTPRAMAGRAMAGHGRCTVAHRRRYR